MCNIHFDESAVRKAFTERATRDQVPLPAVSLNQIFRDVYDGLPVGGVRLHFIQKVKRAMVIEALRMAFQVRAIKEHRDFHQIFHGNAADDVWGLPDRTHRIHVPGEWHDQYRSTSILAQEVQYDMMIEESRAKHAE